MNTRNRFNHALALSVVAVGMVALAAIFIIPVVRAQRGADRLPVVNVLPPVGITFGQTLSVTFLNAGSNPLEIVPCVFDNNGAHLKTGETLRLAPGQMRALDLSRSEIDRRTENRLLVYAGVHADKSDLKNLVVVGEVIEESTGKGSLYVPGFVGPGVRQGFDPQPDPPAAH